MKLNGAGRYDDECTIVREATGAEGVAIIVFGGRDGKSGFSVQAEPAVLMAMPGILRYMADQISAQMDADGDTPIQSDPL